MTVTEAVGTFLQGCPLLAEGQLNIDFLPQDGKSYSLDVSPAAPVVRRYIYGDSLRQQVFVLATRAYYGPLIRQQLDNLEFFEQFSQWVEAQDRAGALPDLGDGRVARRLEVTTSGYVFAPDTDTARYQMQLRLTYWQAG